MWRLCRLWPLAAEWPSEHSEVLSRVSWINKSPIQGSIITLNTCMEPCCRTRTVHANPLSTCRTGNVIIGPYWYSFKVLYPESPWFCYFSVKSSVFFWQLQVLKKCCPVFLWYALAWYSMWFIGIKNRTHPCEHNNLVNLVINCYPYHPLQLHGYCCHHLHIKTILYTIHQALQQGRTSCSRVTLQKIIGFFP